MSRERWPIVLGVLALCAVAPFLLPLIVGAMASLIELYMHFVYTQLWGLSENEISHGLPNKCPSGAMSAIMVGIFVPPTWVAIIYGGAKLIDKIE